MHSWLFRNFWRITPRASPYQSHEHRKHMTTKSMLAKNFRCDESAMNALLSSANSSNLESLLLEVTRSAHAWPRVLHAPEAFLTNDESVSCRRCSDGGMSNESKGTQRLSTSPPNSKQIALYWEKWVK
jgi:hypothetical protein